MDRQSELRTHGQTQTYTRRRTETDNFTSFRQFTNHPSPVKAHRTVFIILHSQNYTFTTGTLCWHRTSKCSGRTYLGGCAFGSTGPHCQRRGAATSRRDKISITCASLPRTQQSKQTKQGTTTLELRPRFRKQWACCLTRGQTERSVIEEMSCA